MASPWEKDPVVGAAAPWERDEVVAAAAPEQGGGFFQDPLRALQLGAQGVGKGIGGIASSPVTLANLAANAPIALADFASQKMGGPELPFRFRMDQAEQIAGAAADAAEGLGFDVIRPEEMTPGERIRDTAIDFGTQALAGGSALAARAPALATRVAARETPRLGDAFVRPYTGNPGITLTGDVVGGVGSGAAVGATQEYAPEEGAFGLPKELLQALAALAGGVGGSASVEFGLRAPVAAGKSVMNALPDSAVPVNPRDPKPYNRATTLRAANVYQAAADEGAGAFSRAPEAADTIRAWTREFDAAGIPTPSTALISGNTGLQRLEGGLRTSDPVRFIERDEALRRAASDRVAGLRDPGADTGAVGRRATEARAAATSPARIDVAGAEAMTEAAAAARAEQGAPVAGMAGSRAATDASRRLDEAVVDRTYLPARATKNDLFRAEGAGTTVDMGEVASVARQLRAQAEALPESIRGSMIRPELLDDLAGIGNMTFDAASRLRMVLASDITKAHAAGEHVFADGLQALRSALSDTLDETAPTAARYYREDFAPRFRPGPGDEAARFTRDIDRDRTRTTTPRDATAGRFLSAPEKAAALRRMVADMPAEADATRAVEDYMTSDFARAALDANGNVVPARAAGWLNANMAILDEFPSVLQRFQRLVAGARSGVEATDEALTAVRAARERLQTAETDFGRSAAGALIGEDPRDLAFRMLSSSQRESVRARLAEITDLMRGDPEAMRGWKAAVADALSDHVTGVARVGEDVRAFTDPEFAVRLGKIEPLFKKHRDALAGVFSPEEMNILQQAHMALAPLKKATIQATAGPNTTDKLMTSLMRNAELLLKLPPPLGQGQLRGGGIMRSIRLALQTLPNKEAAIKQLIIDASFDPKLARYLLTRQLPPDIGAPTSNKWIRRILAAEAFGREGYQGETE